MEWAYRDRDQVLGQRREKDGKELGKLAPVEPHRLILEWWRDVSSKEDILGLAAGGVEKAAVLKLFVFKMFILFQSKGRLGDAVG